MSNLPRLLPLVGVAVAGVLAVNALSGARHLPDLLSAARAYAEDASPNSGKTAKDKATKDPAAKTAETDKPAVAPNANGSAVDAAAVAPSHPAAPVCAPTAAELAKEAGLSPAELRVLQSLGGRRSALDQREKDMDLQLQLLAAAEAKLTARIATMNGLKTDIQGLLTQADSKQAQEADRLVLVYSAMKPKDAAARMTLIDDSVRIPIAAKMKERVLSAVLAQMAPADAKALTEKLAHRVTGADAVRAARSTVSPVAAAATPPVPIQTAANTPPPPVPVSAEPKAVADAGDVAAKPRAKRKPKLPKVLADAQKAVQSAAATMPAKPVPYTAAPALPQATAAAPAPKSPVVPPAAKPSAPAPVAPAKTG